MRKTTAGELRKGDMFWLVAGTKPSEVLDTPQQLPGRAVEIRYKYDGMAYLWHAHENTVVYVEDGARPPAEEENPLV